MKVTSYAAAYGNSAWADMNDFDPLPEMKSANRDLVIVMVWKNSMGYGRAVDDIFFAAHGSEIIGTARGRNETWYFSDFPSSGMGCAQQVGGITFALDAQLMKMVVSVLLRSRWAVGPLLKSYRPSRQGYSRELSRCQRRPACCN